MTLAPRGTDDSRGDRPLRLAEIMIGVSMVADAGMGLEPGEATRACVIACRLAERLDVPDRSAIFYTTLLQHLGCTAYAHEAASALGGDEIAVKSAALRTDFRSPRDIARTYLPGLAPDAGVFTRLRAGGAAIVRSRAITDGYTRANCEVAVMTARRMGLDDGVVVGLGAIFERADGKGGPTGIAGDAIPVAARVAQVAATASLFNGIGGIDTARAVIRSRAGSLLDGPIAATFLRHANVLLADVTSGDAVRMALDAEPPPHVTIRGERIDAVASAFADALDLKTPMFHGHSPGVASLAERTAERLGMGAVDVARLRRAGLLHDIGRAAIPNGIWEKRGPFTLAEWERVRLHAYHAERVLGRCALAHLAPIVGMHAERQDGSGYHRNARGGGIPVSARVLGAANVFQAMTEERPHRPARSRDAAAAELAGEADRGRLDRDVVRALLDALGEGGRLRPASRPAGLTERQVDVLRLVAAGLSNPEIAARIVVSRRTAERHVQDVYAKIGLSTRAGAALFAMEHGLL